MLKKISLISLVTTVIFFVTGLIYQIKYLQEYGVTASSGMPSYDKLAISGFIFIIYYLFTAGMSVYSSVLAFITVLVFFETLFNFCEKVFNFVEVRIARKVTSIKLLKVLLILTLPCIFLPIGIIVEGRVKERVLLEKSGVKGYDTLYHSNLIGASTKGRYVAGTSTHIVFWVKDSDEIISYSTREWSYIKHAKK